MVFRTAGATRCTDWVKCGTEEGQMYPHWCNDKGVIPPKLIFLYYNLIKMRNINAQQFFVSFSQNWDSLYPVSGVLALTISLDLLKRLMSYGVLS